MWSFDTGYYVEALLERGVRTSYLAGNQDAAPSGGPVNRSGPAARNPTRRRGETGLSIINLLARSRPLLSYLLPTYEEQVTSRVQNLPFLKRHLLA